jgi:L-asparaginase
MKTLLVIGTGGTIAGAAPDATRNTGYRAGAVAVTQLVDDLPGLADMTTIRTSQPFSIGSQHMTSTHWLELAALVRRALADDDLDGIVVTHGTDTMEETAFFLDLVTGPGKPTVLTGAMRPATALSADGPANLLGACRFACDDGAAGRGVLVAFGDRAFAAASVTKVHTLRADAFAARDDAALGELLDDTVRWRRPAAAAPTPAFATLALPGSVPGSLSKSLPGALPPALPKVALILQHVDCDEALVDWHLARGVSGIVVAGSGNGMLPDPMRAALARASRSGCIIVRATRVGAGPVVRNAEAEPADRDDALGFVASGFLSALKARILLQCCLAAGLPLADIQRQFDRY